MATYYGVNATKRDNQAIKQLIGPGEVKSPVYIAYDSYTLTAALVQNDVIKMMKLPPGARVHNVQVYFDALDASGGTVDIGWEANTVDSADADGFMADVAVTSAGAQDMQDDQPTRPGVFKQFDSAGGETQVSVTVDHSGGLDATSGSIKLAVYYAID